MSRASRIISALIAVLALSAPAVGYAADGVAPATPDSINIEVAEDGTRFVFDEAPVLDDGFPAYGNGFVTQGYIYPAGTVDGHNGVNPDGTPEFPELVLGEWTCWGYFIGEGATTTEGAWVVTTQVFDFTSGVLGDDSIVTAGYEAPADAGPAIRGVTGGTGRFRNVSGQVTQVTLGHNASDGVNASFEFDLAGTRRIGTSTVADRPRPTLV